MAFLSEVLIDIDFEVRTRLAEFQKSYVAADSMT